MANILFASNNVAHFVDAYKNTNNDNYDQDKVPYAITIAPFSETSSPEFASSTTGEVWFHFRARFKEYSSRDESQKIMFRFTDPENPSIYFEMRQSNTTGYNYNNQYLRYLAHDGNTLKSFQEPIRIPDAPIFNTFDIQFKYVASDKIQFKVYRNNALVFAKTFEQNGTETVNLPTNFTFGSPFGEVYYSEFLVADGDTRNARIRTINPNAQGFWDEWGGEISSLSDDDATSGMFTKQPEKRHTVSLSPPAGLTSISNLVLVSYASVGLNGPDKLKHITRQSLVDYEGPQHQLTDSTRIHVTDFQLNPATGNPWTLSDLQAVEIGMKSET